MRREELHRRRTDGGTHRAGQGADGRVGLLAQHAGLAVGFHEQDNDAPIYLQIGQLCIQAGADTALISRWIAEGRRRAAAAKQFPPPD
jgi:hypothetical protein